MIAEDRILSDLFKRKKNCGLYYKHITIINDAASVIRMTIVSDATTWSVTYDGK